MTTTDSKLRIRLTCLATTNQIRMYTTGTQNKIVHSVWSYTLVNSPWPRKQSMVCTLLPFQIPIPRFNAQTRTFSENSFFFLFINHVSLNSFMIQWFQNIKRIKVINYSWLTWEPLDFLHIIQMNIFVHLDVIQKPWWEKVVQKFSVESGDIKHKYIKLITLEK